jgi:hypothetical protein
MLLIRKIFPKIICCGILSVVVAIVAVNKVSATPYNLKSPLFFQDTTSPKGNTKLVFPIQDRRGDAVSNSKRSTYDLKNPSNLKDSIVYDAKTKRYIVYEKIGNKYYRTPTSYSSEEYWQMRGRQMEIDYFKKRANTTSILNRGKVKPKLSIYDGLFNRLFGNGKINITPQGNVM